MAGFGIDFSDATPIWRQIEEHLRALIVAGVLRPGDPVPSVRELARTLRINPNTVARAYQHLQQTGFLTVRRGAGTYVADDLQPRLIEYRRQLIERAVDQLIHSVRRLHVSCDELIATIRARWDANTPTPPER